MPKPSSSPKKTDDFLVQVLKANPGIDRNLIADLQRYEEIMRRAGIDPKPQFKVQPPLGGDLFGLRLSNG